MDVKPHQAEGITWLKTKRGAILGDEMGLGKTMQSLGVFTMRIWANVKIDPNRRCKLLVVAPASLRENWAEEIEQFTHLPYCLPKGTDVKRFEQLEEFRALNEHKIVVMNYEILEKHIQQLNAFDFDMIVFDEGHKLKTRTTKTYKNCAKLRSKSKLVVTGTPMTNQVDDLWAILDLINPGEWGTYYGFRAKYCVLGGYNGKQVVSSKNEKQLNARLSQVMLRRKIDDVIDLPEVNIVRRNVSLGGKPREMYNYLATEHRLKPFVPTLTDEQDEALEYPMVRQLRFRQICSSTCTLIPSWDESPKLDLAIEDAKEILDNGHKLVVFTQFLAVKDAFIARLEKARPGTPVYQIHGGVDKDKRQGIKREWEECDGASVCVGIISAMGVGLNMTAARHAQFIDKEYSPALNRQAIGRLRRIGAEKHGKPIQVFEYYVRNSAEYRVEEILKDKIEVFENVVEGSPASIDFMAKIEAAMEGTL